MGSQVKKLTVKGFRSIRSLDNFDLGSLNVLIGRNGSGKSNFLSFFSAVQTISQQDLLFSGTLGM